MKIVFLDIFVGNMGIRSIPDLSESENFPFPRVREKWAVLHFLEFISCDIVQRRQKMSVKEIEALCCQF